MKKAFLIVFILAAYLAVNSQTFILTDIFGTNITNSEVIVVGHPDSALVEYHIHVKNNTTNGISVKVKKTELNVVANTVNYFCWVNCYPPTTYISTMSLNMAAGHTTVGAEDLLCDYMPSGQVGSSRIAYTVYDKNNVADSVRVVVNYDITTNINNLSLHYKGFSQPYPNPAINEINFNYNLDNYSNVYVELFDILGKTIQKQYIRNSSGKISFNISALRGGIYYYSIVSNNKTVKTNKFIVTN